MTIKPGDRIHCDKWLAHRPEGWVVLDHVQGYVNIDVEGHIDSWITVPFADCTLVPRPFKVGDWVRTENGTVGLIYAVRTDNRTEVWVGYADGNTGWFGAKGQNHLTHTEAPNA